MANKKFSEFDLKTSSSDVAFVVGFNGSDNVRITPANLAPAAPVTSVNSLTGAVSLGLTQLDDVGSDGTNGQVLTTNGSGSFTFTTASGGASSLNGLTDCLVDTDSVYLAEVPSSLSGNPQGNLVVGVDAGNALTSGANNTLLGNDAGKNLTTTASNVIIGKNSGLAKTSGGNTVIIGTAAGRDTASGDYFVLIGSEAGISNTGSNAIAIGFEAGRVNTATSTISIGYQAGYSNTSAPNNTNIGYKAGYSNTTEDSRTIVGYECGEFSTGSDNTFMGRRAGRGSSGQTNSGSKNSAIGQSAGLGITTGAENTFLGFQAGQSNTTSSNNTFIGSRAAGSATVTGGNNTGVGYSALTFLSSGTNNAVLGYQAGNSITTGSNNTVIGYDADSSSATVSNEITLGNSSITALRCAVTSITSLSDERDKSEIKDLDYGLAFIDALQPREFVWDNRPETDKDGEEFYSANKGKKDFGFIAQEVRELDNDTLRLVYSENEEKLELSYGKLVPILVKAIQELKEEVELLKS